MEKDKWSGLHPQRFKIYRWEDMVAGKCPNSLEMQAVCRNLSRTTQVGCTLLKTVEAGNSLRMWKEPCIDGPGCLDWDGCRCCLVDKEKKRERKVCVHLVPSMCIKPIVTLLRYPHGTELVMAGRIRLAEGMDVAWLLEGNSRGLWFCETCRMVLWRSGAKVLSWNVSGDVFLSQTSMLKTGC